VSSRPEVAVGHAQTRFDESGRLTDETIREQLNEVVDLVAQAAESARRALAA